MPCPSASPTVGQLQHRASIKWRVECATNGSPLRIWLSTASNKSRYLHTEKSGTHHTHLRRIQTIAPTSWKTMWQRAVRRSVTVSLTARAAAVSSCGSRKRRFLGSGPRKCSINSKAEAGPTCCAVMPARLEDAMDFHPIRTHRMPRRDQLEGCIGERQRGAVCSLHNLHAARAQALTRILHMGATGSNTQHDVLVVQRDMRFGVGVFHFEQISFSPQQVDFTGHVAARCFLCLVAHTCLFTADPDPVSHRPGIEWSAFTGTGGQSDRNMQPGSLDLSLWI